MAPTMSSASDEERGDADMELDLFGMDVDVDLGMDTPGRGYTAKSVQRPKRSPHTPLRTISCENVGDYVDDTELVSPQVPPSTLARAVDRVTG